MKANIFPFARIDVVVVVVVVVVHRLRVCYLEQFYGFTKMPIGIATERLRLDNLTEFILLFLMENEKIPLLLLHIFFPWVLRPQSRKMPVPPLNTR